MHVPNWLECLHHHCMLSIVVCYDFCNTITWCLFETTIEQFIIVVQLSQLVELFIVTNVYNCSLNKTENT